MTFPKSKRNKLECEMWEIFVRCTRGGDGWDRRCIRWETEREVARSQKCSRVLCLSLFTGRRRALVYIIYPERFPKAAIISTPDSARCVCFSHFITCGCVWCRERPTEICAALWITKHTARAAEAQAGRRNKAQKKWTGAWRSLRPRRQRAPALLASNLSLHCYTLHKGRDSWWAGAHCKASQKRIIRVLL